MEAIKAFLKKLFKKKTKPEEQRKPTKPPLAQWQKNQNKNKKRSMYSGYEKRSKQSRRKKK